MKEKRMKRKQVRKTSRLSQSNTPRGWKKVRNICGRIALVGGVLLGVIASGGLALPAVVPVIIGMVTSTAAGIAGAAALTKDEKLIDNDK